MERLSPKRLTLSIRVVILQLIRYMLPKMTKIQVSPPKNENANKAQDNLKYIVLANGSPGRALAGQTKMVTCASQCQKLL